MAVLCVRDQSFLTSGDMRACVIILTLIVFSSCVTLHQTNLSGIKSKTKIELKPILITCALSDIVVISAPIVHNAVYYLFNPKGDCAKLNIKPPKYEDKLINYNEYDKDNIVIHHSARFKGIIPLSEFRIFSLADYKDSKETYEKHTRELKANDFVIGPLLSSDHGNWVLSAYVQDIDGDWVENFQVITIEIIESVPVRPSLTVDLKPGDTFEVSFAYPIHNLTSCELTAPKSTFDRFYERSTVNMDTCGYIVKNVTRADQGFWKITGVGSIVYMTQVYLKVKGPK